MSLMPLTIMPNKSAKASSSTEKTKNCVGLPHQHQFITMVLIRRRTILWQATCFVQRLVQPSTFISVEKIWGNSISQLFGRHNIMNATAVIGLLYIAGFDLDLVREHLKTFAGVKRRFTEKVVNGTVIIDDFAHHPTEIIATLDAARQKYPSKEIVAVFQPHTFTRTIALLDEFADALNQADAVYLAQIYGSAREVDHGDVKVERSRSEN